jgi:hypothetical protein
MRITDIVTRSSTNALIRGAELQTHVIPPFSIDIFQPRNPSRRAP